jgi:hypothetical protein
MVARRAAEAAVSEFEPGYLLQISKKAQKLPAYPPIKKIMKTKFTKAASV